jgi:ankyrin repeat protein
MQMQAEPAVAQEGAAAPAQVALQPQAALNQQEKERQQRHALFSAAARGDSDEVRRLIQEEHIDVNVRDEFGTTALHRSFKNGRADSAKVLIEAGANRNARSAEHATPLWLAAENDSIDLLPLIQSFGGFDVNLQNAEGTSPLIAAILHGNTEFAIHLARIPEVDVNIADSEGANALFYCVMANHEDVARVLLEERQASVTVIARRNHSALNLAAQGGLDNMVKLLLSNGAKVLLEHRTAVGTTPLASAVSIGKLSTVKLLRAAGANVDARDYRLWTPFVVACSNGSLELAQYLQDAGADITATNKFGWSALTSSVNDKQFAGSRYLLAQEGIDVNHRAEGGTTPLMFGVSNDDVDHLYLLMTAGADPLLQDDKGWSSLSLAIDLEHSECCKILLDGVSTSALTSPSSLPNNPHAFPYDSLDSGLEDQLSGFVEDLFHRTLGMPFPAHRGAIRWALTSTAAAPLVASSRATDNYKTYHFVEDPLFVTSETNASLRVLRDDAWRRRRHLLNLRALAKSGKLRKKSRLVAVVQKKSARDPWEAKATSTEERSTAAVPPLTPVEKLFVAVAWKSPDEVREALAGGLVDPNSRNAINWTPLMECAANGDEDTAREILNDPRTNVNLTNNDGQSALGLAAENGSLPLVVLLIGRGANVDNVNKMGFTPVMLASLGGHTIVVYYLAGLHQANIHVKNYRGMTSLHFACRLNEKQLAEYLLSKKADPNSVDFSNLTPLTLACHNKAADAVEVLLRKEADTSIITLSGWSPLSFAVSGDDETIVSALIKEGAPVNHPDSKAVQPILTAVEFGNVRMVELLLAAGANIEARDSLGSTALAVACYAREWGIARILIDAGADVDAADKRGRSPIFAALEVEDYSLCQLLLGRGCRVDIKAKDGLTPVLLAMRTFPDVTTVFRMLVLGADPNVRADDGWSALMTAVKFKWKYDCLEMLRYSGSTDFNVPFPPEDVERLDIPWATLDEGLAQVLSPYLKELFDASSRAPITLSRPALHWALTSPAAGAIAATCLAGVGSGTTRSLRNRNDATRRELRLAPLQNDAWKRRRHLCIAMAAKKPEASEAKKAKKK